MKRLLTAILILSGFFSYGQSVGYLRYDTVKVMKNGGVATLKVEGALQGTTYSTTFTTSSNAPAIGQSFNLGTIVADRTITFLDLESGRNGTFIYVYNSNSSAFVWNVAGNVYEGDGTVITNIPRGLHIFKWEASRWIRLSTSGGSSPTVDTLTFSSPLVQLDKNVSLDYDAFPQDTAWVEVTGDTAYNKLYSHTGTRDSTAAIGPASDTRAGLMTTKDQTFDGVKSFRRIDTDTIISGSLTSYWYYGGRRGWAVSGEGTTANRPTLATDVNWLRWNQDSLHFEYGNLTTGWHGLAGGGGAGTVTSLATGYGLTGGTITTTGTLRADTNVIATLANRDKLKDSLDALLTRDPYIFATNALGGTLKGQTVGATGPSESGTSYTLTDGTAYILPVYLSRNTTLTGAAFIQVAQGSYTGDNYNGIVLYTYSGGTLTKVAETTNDADFWKSTAQAFVKKPFASTYAASAGLYFLAFIYNSSAQTTAPTVARSFSGYSGAAIQDFTNSAKLYSTTTGVTTAATSFTMSSLSINNAVVWSGIY